MVSIPEHLRPSASFLERRHTRVSEVGEPPRGGIHQETRQVMHKGGKAEQWLIPVARHPRIVHVVTVRAVLDLTTGRASEIVEQGLIDAVPAETQV